jgi:nickel and cobalt resistance protein CnrR
MTPLLRPILAGIVLAAIAGALGGWMGVEYGLSHSAKGLDEILHHQLNLTPDQQARIEVLEKEYEKTRRELEAQMLAANKELAAALESEHALGPTAREAIEKSHHAMGDLQEQTIMHVLSMRAVLNAEQVQRFDRTVREALSPDRM